MCSVAHILAKRNRRRYARFGETKLNVFVVVATSESYSMPATQPEGVADYIRISDNACLVLGKGIAPTTSEVAKALDIGEASEKTGIVVKAETYYGYDDQSIWEKLQTWANRTPT